MKRIEIMAKMDEMNVAQEIAKTKPHWIAENERPKSFKWICSECGSTVYDMPMCNKKNYKKMCLYQYCPYCGVRMDLSEVAE